MIDIYDMIDLLRAALVKIDGLERALSNELMPEGITDLPTIQIYPDSGEGDATAANERTTFRGGIRQERLTILIDYYARQRSHLGEDMAALTRGLDAMRRLFRSQNHKPFFGVETIQTFSWSWQRIVFTYGGTTTNPTSYYGVRFTLTFNITV